MKTKEWEEEDFLDKLRRKAGYKEDREELLNILEKNVIRRNSEFELLMFGVSNVIMFRINILE